MISFMVLAGPRSATTWLSNLLTTDTTLCLHDPLLEHPHGVVEQMSIPGKRIGIADTAAMLWPEWVRPHPARKVLLWRDPTEANESLRALGLRELDRRAYLLRIEMILTPTVRVYHWSDVFKPAIAHNICKFFGVPFCRWRFEELQKMNIQPQFNKLPVGREAAQELIRRLAQEVNS